MMTHDSAYTKDFILEMYLRKRDVIYAGGDIGAYQYLWSGWGNDTNQPKQYLADIATYGLFTYEEFAEMYPIPEEMFNAVNGQYLKISIGKEIIDYETLGNLIENYSHVLE